MRDVDPETATKLAAVPGVQRHPNSALDLFVLRNWLNPEDCASFCSMIDARRRPSTISDDQGIANFRTSETCDLSSTDPLVCKVRSGLSALLGIPDSHAEPLQGQRYAPGQEFRAHTDTFNPGRADFYEHCAEAGQRTWTAMVYLNTPEDGGSTRFKMIGKSIRPETGKLLIWNNLSPDGAPNPATLHQGMKVRKGVKYILTLWYRERPLESG